MAYSSKNPKLSTTILTDQTTSSVSAAPSSSHRLINRSGNLWLIDSSGVERPVGGASSGINYLSDWFNASKAIGTVATVAATGNITVAGSKPLTNSAWYADTTSGASAIALSTSTALRFSSNYLTALSGSSSSGATFVQTAAFTVDDSDLGKPVSISFDLTGVTTADDWDIVVARYTVSGTTGTYAELIPVAGTLSSITGTPGAQLPTGTTQFRGFFVAGTTSTDVYALRFRRRTGTTQIRIDSLTVGPQSLAQGAVVTAWQSYTPSIAWPTSNQGTLDSTNTKVQTRRVGNTLEIRGYIAFSANGTSASNFEFTLPTGLTPDNSIVAVNSNRRNYETGQGYVYRAGALSSFEVFPRFDTTTTSSSGQNCLSFVLYSAGTPETYTNLAPVNLTNVGDRIRFRALIPIAEWSSGTTTLADGAVEEYAWNSDTSAANDTTNFAYGLDGVKFPNITGFGTNYSKRVRFQTTLLPTDNLFLEYQLAGAGPWRNAAQRFPFLSQGASSYGIQLVTVSANDVDVQFRAQGALATNATYAGNGEAWSTYFGDGTKWRLRKVSSGAAVGFPVSARNIVGDISGTVVPAGYVGEQLSQSRAATSSLALTTTTAANITATALTLTPGTWDISGFMGVSGSATSVTQVIASVSTTSATIGAQDNAYIVDGATRNLSTSDYGAALPVYRVSIASNTTYYLVGRVIFSGGGNTANAFGRIQAVRVG